VAEDGALALDVDDVLKAWESFVSVPRMPHPAGQALPARQRRADSAATKRARRLAGLVLLAAVVLVILLMSAFGSGRPAADRAAAPAPATRLLPAGPPSPEVVALAGGLRLQLPIAQSRVTAIGYHGSGDGAVALQPLGTQANAGALTRFARRVFGGQTHGLRYYQLSGGDGSGTSALDVGAAPGTDVYSPVDGTIVALTPYVVNGKTYGARIDIQPTAAPSLVVSLAHLSPEKTLTVGSSVAAGVSKVGSLLDFSAVERQALARYTQDAGNHVELEVRSGAAVALP
jgi:murein DD-endopeptidase MepM/ murein hydrolase activator NlpD